MSEALLAPEIRPTAVARPVLPVEDSIEIPGLLRIVAAPVHARFAFRARAEALLQAQKAFGLSLPQTVGHVQSAPPRHALKLGPDEWLLIAPPHEADHFGQGLRVAQPSSLVEISSRDAVLMVEGVRAEDVLNAGCPLDLHPDVFPVQGCTRTVFGCAEIVLWRTGDHAFQVATQRSFGRYLFGLLRKAAQEHEAV